MTWSEPHFLWALLLLPLLWWLSQPPKPRRHVFSAHLAQWQLAMRALRRKPPRGSWLRFALLAVAFVAAVLAAAQPEVGAVEGPERLVVLLDSSQSMAARVRPAAAAPASQSSAFRQATAELAQAFAALPANVAVTVLRCGGELRRRHGRAARALHDLGPPAGELAVDLVQLAERAQGEDTVVWTLTDGQGCQQLPAVGALSVYDTARPNGAIAGVRWVDAWPLAELQLEVDVVAFVGGSAADAEISAVLSVAGATSTPIEANCTLAPGIVQTQKVAVQRLAAGGDLEIELRLPGDGLAEDNRYICRLPALPAPRIAAFAEADAGPFAAAAAEALAAEVGGEVLLLDAGVSKTGVSKTGGAKTGGAKTGAAAADGTAIGSTAAGVGGRETIGVVLADGGVLPLLDADGRMAKVRAITFGTRLDPQVEVQPWLMPTPIDWARDAELTRGLDLSELAVERAWSGMLPAGEPILWWFDGAQRQPLAVLVDAGDTASVHLAFRLQDSNLPLLAAFPQLLRRAYVRCYGGLAAGIQPAASQGRSPPPASERNLLDRVSGASRSLPQFGRPAGSVAGWFVLVGMGALLLRALLR